jgi:lipopolysaccharide transport system permease protein
MRKSVLSARIPVALAFPDEMQAPVKEVMDGKYEAGFDGSGLTILDIGANVGSFTLWANLRWPESTIYAYEPEPRTFALLVSNIGNLPNVTCYNVAVYPSEKEQEPLYSRYPGDGEAGLVVYLGKMFAKLPEDGIVSVRVLHPKYLPPCDIIKIDTEGAEPEILGNMNLHGVSMILMEYHYAEHRDRIKDMLAGQFDLAYERNYEWGALLDGTGYRQDLKDDFYGQLCFVNRETGKLRRRFQDGYIFRKPVAAQQLSTQQDEDDSGSPASSSADDTESTPVVGSPAPASNTGAGDSPRRSRRVLYLRDLLRELIARDMKLRYKRSAVGFAWALLNPLLQLFILSFIFRSVLPLSIPNYSSFLFTGLLVWGWFSSSLFQATEAIVGQRELIRKPGFPSAVLPVVTVASQLIHFLLALPVLLLFLILTHVPITGWLLLLPFVIALQFALTLSLAYLVAVFHVTFRDTQYLVGVLLLLGFYLTPIFYDASAIPARYQLLYHLNPMVPLTEAYRFVLMQGRLPDLAMLLVLSIVTVILLYVGYHIFTRASVQFAEEL